MKRYCIVVAGGSGSRMKSSVPKQFLLLKDKPILIHTLERLVRFDPGLQIILVLPEAELDIWNTLKADYSFHHPVQVTAGGATRFQSVSNGLKRTPENCVVGIHDAVRPLISPALLERCFSGAEDKGSAVPVVPVHESLRRISKTASTQVDRSEFVVVQTPQCFQSSLLKKAFEQPEDLSFTDDASVFEKSGKEVNLVEGEKWNIKITLPEDLAIASTLL
ncbi:MAG TPA: 2-C-methyl-D-erythritol 4-phosphate cytidylyltransferase [Bacteroidia bacterium]|nr:2-C-methyl-D-erythritol 4-phosphate cytidylyltransferase [Bacteroidia bacterium]